MFEDLGNKKFIIMMGLPKSGKTTFVYNDLKKDNNIVISSNSLRKLIYGQDYYANGESIVWTVHQYMLQEMMNQGINIIIDETNETKEKRSSLIKAAKNMNYSIVGVMMATPFEVCQKRAQNKDYLMRQLKEKAEMWENPKKEEGFNKVMVIDHDKYSNQNNNNRNINY